MDMSLRIAIKRPAWDWNYHVHIAQPTSDGLAIMQPCTFKVIPRDELHMESKPAFHFEKEGAQLFMDELWNAGFRPSEGTGSAGAMAAVQAHLKDMQRLVFTEKEQRQ